MRSRTAWTGVLGLALAMAGCTLRSRPIRTLPGIEVDPEAGRVAVEGRICIQQGIIEYLAVASEGKTYESVVELGCRPSQLHAAMLIAGYCPGNLPAGLRGDFAPQAAPVSQPAGAPSIPPPPGDYWSRPESPTRLAIDLETRRGNTWTCRPIEEFLIDRRTGRCPAPLTWAFTGSFFERSPTSGREEFAADVQRSIVAVWYDPTALLNLAQDAGNPYRGEQLGFQVNQEALPAMGTPVRLVFRRVR